MAGSLEHLPSRARHVLSTLRLKPFDTSTDDGRARERYRRASLTAVAGVVSRVLALSVSLVTVPLTLHYLGDERYGMWMTISSISALLVFADLGIGNGLLNAVATAFGSDDRTMAREAVSSATALLSAVALVIAGIMAVLAVAVPWEDVFNVTAPASVREAGPAVVVFVACFAASIPLSVVQRVQMGYQEGYLTHLWQVLGSVLGLVAVVLAIELEAGLPWLVLAISGGPVLALVANWLAEFGRSRPWLWPRRRYFRRAVARGILGVGILFFVLQLAMAFGFATDNLIIAQILGSAAVTDYAVPFKLFSVITVIVTIAFSPLWPAYGEAATRGDFPWVRRTLGRSLLWALALSAAPAALLVAFGGALLTAWVGSSVQASTALLLGLAVWCVLSSVGATLAIGLNGLGLIKVQAVLAVLMAVVSITLKIVLTDQFGVAGVAWGTALAYAACIGVPLAVYVPRRLGRMMTAPPAAVSTQAPSAGDSSGPLPVGTGEDLVEELGWRP